LNISSRSQAHDGVVVKRGGHWSAVVLSRALLCLGYVAESAHAAGETTRLSCDIEVTASDKAGHAQTAKETSVLEIREIDALTSIRLNSSAMPILVTNKRIGTVSVFVDSSNDARWDISSVQRRTPTDADDLRIILDRTTLHLTASRLATIDGVDRADVAVGVCHPVLKTPPS
jgi:hypothetical protein